MTDHTSVPPQRGKIAVPNGYRRCEIPKDGGGFRVVLAPSWYVRYIQDEIISVNHPWIKQVKFPRVDKAIKLHLREKNRFFLKMDIRGAFDSVTKELLELVGIFCDHDWYVNKNFHSSGDLSDVCFHKGGGLIQGSPLSPHLFEIYCQRVLDVLLDDFCGPRNIVYTRFVDDLLFSSRQRFSRKTRKIIRGIILQAGFGLNTTKDRVVDTQLVDLETLGLLLYRGHVSPNDEFKRKLERIDSCSSDESNGLLSHKKFVESMNSWHVNKL